MQDDIIVDGINLSALVRNNKKQQEAIKQLSAQLVESRRKIDLMDKMIELLIEDVSALGGGDKISALMKALFDSLKDQRNG